MLQFIKKIITKENKIWELTAKFKGSTTLYI